MKLTDLKEGQVVQCNTDAEFKRIISLNQNNCIEDDRWRYFKEYTIYDPNWFGGQGGYGSSKLMGKGETEIFDSSLFDSEPEIQFESGDMVIAWDNESDSYETTPQVYVANAFGKYIVCMESDKEYIEECAKNNEAVSSSIDLFFYDNVKAYVEPEMTEKEKAKALYKELVDSVNAISNDTMLGEAVRDIINKMESR